MMKKWILPACALATVALCVAAVAIWISLPSQLPDTAVEGDTCARYGIGFDASSVTRLYQDPEAILEDPASFWNEDRAYTLVAMAPRYQGASLPPAGWARHVERILSTPEEKRARAAPFARSQEIMQHADAFCAHAVPTIQSLLPEGTDLGTTIYLTAYNDPPCFVFRSSVVMNADTPDHFGKTSKFFNLLGHELLHIGYFNHQPQQTEVWPDSYPLKVLLTTLQNDGLAVYLQSELSPLYPAPAEIELLLLDSKLATRFMLKQVNRLLQESQTSPEEEVLAKVYRARYRRALYVTGAHMARTIDGALGRAALVATVSRGPRSFVATYNSVAEPGMEVQEIEQPPELSPVQVLRKAVVEERYESLHAVVDAIMETGIRDPGGATFQHLESTGLLLLQRDQADLAAEIFQLMVSLYPQHPYGHLYLAEAYSQCGEVAKAQAAHSRALELDSRLASAIER